MAKNDIYNSKGKYEKFKENIKNLIIMPKAISKRKYYCRNKENLKYIYKLCTYFESRDTSYIRRIRLLQTFKAICYTTDKDLNICNRDDVNKTVAFLHSVYKTPKSKSDFLRDLRYIWKHLFPDNDEKGRPDETVVPYVVRHLNLRIDKSIEKLRDDRLDFDEFEKVITYFGRDKRIQSYITLANESLGRPQEILYIKIKDVELFENYAKLYISEHGKEGCGFLQCIDSYPYLIKWLEEHPFKNDPDSFLFINLGNRKRGHQLTPQNINALLKIACTDLGINKSVTCYSLKRNGVTFRRLKGESDVEIQHAARWTSTRQLSTYDFSNQEDALKKQLVRKGIIQPGKEMQKYAPDTKACSFCNFKNGFTDEFCGSCKRPLDRKKIKALCASEQGDIHAVKKELSDIRKQLALRQKFDQELAHILKSPQVQKIYQEMCRETSS